MSALAAPALTAADVAAAAAAIGEVVRHADVVVPVGGRTHWDVGGPAPVGAEVRAPAGVVAHDPAELTATVGAGTTVAALSATLGAAGQWCPLDPRSPDATVGGTIAAGLSGHRRLRWGPLRDTVLEVRFVLGDGRHVKGGGPTVKNVTGYDLPRLLVGSLGTLGVITQVTLRCQPLPAASVWGRPTTEDPRAVRRRLHKPACAWWDGTSTWVLVEGHPADVAVELAAAGVEPDPDRDAPPWPHGAVRARASVAPGRLHDIGGQLGAVPGLTWGAEMGIGTVHLAAADAGPVLEAARIVDGVGGWVLREAGVGLEATSAPLPLPQVHARLRAAFDPHAKLNPGRLFA